jgi:hypothetical protein
MNNMEFAAIPMATFKNIIVTVTETDDKLELNCVETIPCTALDTILNFQLVQVADTTSDYRFDMPDLSGDTSQFGQMTISKSGKMLTLCNAVTEPGKIKMLLKAHDHLEPTRHGARDPEVINQPEG